jgi:hypothetical protein
MASKAKQRSKTAGPASAPAELDRLRPSDPAMTEPESGPGAAEQLEPEASDDEPAELAPPGSNPLTPLTPEQQQHLTLAAEALDRLRLGFEDRHLPIVRGLRAAPPKDLCP